MAATEKKCNICRQRWAPIKIARDSPHGRWMEIRNPPKIPVNIDYQLCKNYQLRTECPKGAECSFAHCKMELDIWNAERQFEPRPPPPISGPYQYQLCKHKANTGSCPYGQRCLFAHTEEELKQWLRRQAGTEGGVTGSNYGQQPSGEFARIECSVCGLTCTSVKQLEAHFSGSRHKQMLMNKPPGQYTVPTAPVRTASGRRRPTLGFLINEYKMCRHIIAGHRCIYGDFCTFAHTSQEMDEWNRQLYSVSRSRAPPTVSTGRRYLNPGGGQWRQGVCV